MAKNSMEITIQKISAAQNVTEFNIAKAHDASLFLFKEELLHRVLHFKRPLRS